MVDAAAARALQSTRRKTTYGTITCMSDNVCYSYRERLKLFSWLVTCAPVWFFDILMKAQGGTARERQGKGVEEGLTGVG